jgi:integrase
MGVKVREHPPKSGIWYVKIDHNGKRKSKKIGRDKREANRIAKRLEAKLAAGDLRIDKAKTPTFKKQAQRYRGLSNSWKESTQDLHQRNLKKHIYRVLGHRPIDEITRADLIKFFNDLLMKGYAVNTVKNIKSTVSNVFRSAVDEEIIPMSPCRDIGIKGKKKQPTDYLTAEEAAHLLDVARESEYYPPLLCLLALGIRLGEMQALQWKDVDFDRGTIKIHRSNRGGRLTETKNKRHREVNAPSVLMDVLKELNTSGTVILLDTDFVFSIKPRLMLKRNTFRRAFCRLLTKAGLRRIRVHDLRHSYASIRLSKGDHIADVSKQLGHSSISITMDVYGHLEPGAFSHQVEELGEILTAKTRNLDATKELGVIGYA